MTFGEKARQLGFESCLVRVLHGGIYYVFGPKSAHRHLLKWYWMDDAAAHEHATIAAGTDACCFTYDGVYPVVWLSGIPCTAMDIGLLAHETLHAILYIARTMRLPVLEVTEEFFCYAMQGAIDTVLSDTRSKPTSKPTSKPSRKS